MQAMIEQQPSFEDDRIRAWMSEPGAREPEQFMDDPTLMHVDADREEIYESRTYRFRTTPEVLAFLVEVVTSRLAGTGAPDRNHPLCQRGVGRSHLQVCDQAQQRG